MPFAITISEKGGAERREVFDKNEISVGRVQGNDLMLPKGNVSKRHAKLTFKDGRFVVTDLKSTNGTYVNGRKIAQATIVREGDKIYVGDFVLRFEAPAGAVLAAESVASARDADQPSAPIPNAVPAPAPALVSHFPLEHDPDEPPPAAAPRPSPQVPQAPRVPSGFGPKGPSGTALLGQSPFADASSRPPLAPQAQPSVSVSPAHSPSSAAPPRSPQQPAAPSPSQAPPPVSRDPARAREAAAHAAHRLALATLVDRVSEMIDLTPLRSGVPAEESLAQRVERAIREQVVSLRQDGDIPAEVDGDALARDGQREILGLGPVGPLLEDDDVSEIHASRDVVWVIRAGQSILIEPPFSSEEALARVVARLAVHAGAPLAHGECLVERQVGAARLVAAVGAVAANGPVLTLRKRRRPDGGTEDPVRAGVVSRGMWTFLSQCLSARLNVLLSAPVGVPLGSFLSALLATTPDAERAVIVQTAEDPILGGSSATLLETSLEELGRAAGIASGLGSARLVIVAASAAAAAAALEAAGSGRGGVIVVVRGQGLRHGLQRLSLDFARSAGVPLDLARETAHSAFDVGVELYRQKDGRARVIRVSEIEPAAPRDVFQFSVDRPGGDGSFAPTGHVPRFIEDLRLRGLAVDPTVFDRQSVRSRDSALKSGHDSWFWGEASHGRPRIREAMRFRFLSGLLFSSLCVVACGGSSDDGSTGGGAAGATQTVKGTPVARADFAATYAKAYCASISGCCAAGSFPYDGPKCEVYMASLARSAFPDDPSLLDYDPVAAGDCIATTASMTVACKEVEEPEPAACKQMFTGKVPEGGTCDFSTVCAPVEGARVACYRDDVGGKCRANRIGKLGDSCDISCTRDKNGNSTCVIPIPGGTECYSNDGLYCDSAAQCKPIAKLGDACTAHAGCPVDTFCDAGKCAAPLALGAKCETPSLCANSYCDYSDETMRVCVPRKKDAATCYWDMECESGYCDSINEQVLGTCRAAARRDDLKKAAVCSGIPILPHALSGFGWCSPPGVSRIEPKAERGYLPTEAARTGTTFSPILISRALPGSGSVVLPRASVVLASAVSSSKTTINGVIATGMTSHANSCFSTVTATDSSVLSSALIVSEPNQRAE